MDKDYPTWHNLKAKVHNHEPTVHCKPREVWWVCLGHNIGYEQDGKGENFERPVLVIKTFSTGLFLGMPLTSQQKVGDYYFGLQYNGISSIAILSQVRAFSNKRLLNKAGVVPIDMFNSLKMKFIQNVLS